MDIKLEKKPWYIRYRYYLAGGILFLAFIIYVIILLPVPASFASTKRMCRLPKSKMINSWNM